MYIRSGFTVLLQRRFGDDDNDDDEGVPLVLVL